MIWSTTKVDQQKATRNSSKSMCVSILVQCATKLAWRIGRIGASYNGGYKCFGNVVTQIFSQIPSTLLFADLSTDETNVCSSALLALLKRDTRDIGYTFFDVSRNKRWLHAESLLAALNASKKSRKSDHTYQVGEWECATAFFNEVLDELRVRGVRW